jgi:hypothetical protein
LMKLDLNCDSQLEISILMTNQLVLLLVNNRLEEAEHLVQMIKVAQC